MGHVEDRVVPSKEYSEKKLQELENGEFRAEPSAEMVSKDEIAPDVLVIIFDSKGSLSVKKGITRVAMPRTRAIERRLSVINCLMMLALKHVNREEIQDITKDLFDRYKDYMLRDYVWGLSSTDLQGNQVQTLPWSLDLAYGHAVRKRGIQKERKSPRTRRKGRRKVRDRDLMERRFAFLSMQLQGRHDGS